MTKKQLQIQITQLEQDLLAASQKAAIQTHTNEELKEQLEATKEELTKTKEENKALTKKLEECEKETMQLKDDLDEYITLRDRLYNEKPFREI